MIYFFVIFICYLFLLGFLFLTANDAQKGFDKLIADMRIKINQNKIKVNQ
jgi:hypothetical protein